MTLLALLVSIWAPAVSAQSDAIRVDALLKDLAAQSGAKLECAPDVGREAVVVQFQDEPLEDVLERLAKVVGAEWSESESAKRLFRSPELLKKEAATEKARLLSQWKALCDGMIKEVEAMPPVDEAFADSVVSAPAKSEGRDPDDDYQSSLRLLQTNPSARAVAKFVATLDPTRFFEMRIGQRVAYSDVPTAMQVPFPRAWNRPLAEYRHHLEMLFAARERAAGRTRQPGFYGLPELGRGSLESGYGKTVLALKRDGLLSLSWEMTTVDRATMGLLFAAGRIPDASRRLFPTTAGGGAALEFSARQKDFAYMFRNTGYAEAGGGAEIRLPDGTVLRPMYGISMAESQNKPPDLGLADLLGDPISHDPVGPLAGNLLRQIAKKDHRPLLASISDGAVLALMRSMFAAEAATDAAVMSVFLQDQVAPAARVPYVEKLDDPKWSLLRPTFPSASRAGRFDRGAMAALFSAIREKGSLLLGDAAKYLKSSAFPSFGSLAMLCMFHANPQVPREEFGWAFSEALPFLSQLTPAQLDLLATRGSTYRDLSPAQQETVRRWVFDEYERERTPQYRGAVMLGPLAGDPTEQFQNGIPLDTPILIRRATRPAVRVRMENGYRFNWDAGSFVENERIVARGGLFGNKVSRVAKGYRPATMTEYLVEVRLAPTKTLRRGCNETAMTPGSKEVAQGDLSPEFLAQVEAVRKAQSAGPRPPGGNSVTRPRT